MTYYLKQLFYHLVLVFGGMVAGYLICLFQDELVRFLVRLLGSIWG